MLALMENSAEMIALLDEGANIVYTSPSVKRILGWSSEDLAGKYSFGFAHPDDLSLLKEWFERVLSAPGCSSVGDCRARTPDGRWMWLEVSFTNLLHDETIGAVVVNFHDISDRKKLDAERQVIFETVQAMSDTPNLDELLRKIHRALKTVVYAENCFIALHDPETGLFHFPFLADQHDPEPPPPQKMGRTCTAYVFRTGKPQLIPRRDFARLVQKGEFDLVGTPSASWLGVPLRTPSATVGVLVVQHYEDENAYSERDLEFLSSVGGQIALAIERKRTEEALHKEQEENTIIFNSARSLILYKDRKFRIIRANLAAREFFGRSLDGAACTEIAPFALTSFDLSQAEEHAVIETGESMLGSIEKWRNAIGQQRTLRIDRVPFRDQSGAVAGVIIFAMDVTEQSESQALLDQTRQVLTESEARYRQLFENAAYGIYRTTAEGYILEANPALVTLLGYTSRNQLLTGRAQDWYNDPEEREALIQETLTKGRLDGREVDWKKRDGTVVHVRLSARLLRGDAPGSDYLEGIAENITERRALETQLQQAQRMEAVGRLAGGVAHDFNNLLMVIRGHADLLLERVGTSHPDHRKVDQIKRAADRAATLTRQLLAFGRMQILQPRVLDLNLIVNEMGKMLPPLLGEQIGLQISTAANLGSVKADPSQLEQVILNLAVNARDAMPNGGRLRIETSEVELREEDVHTRPPLEPGNFVVLTVIDTGIGMDSATQAHIFEPFFTTKEKGKGTGLGLATVYGVVKQSGGYIWVSSEPNKGARFEIYLPRVRAVRETKQEAPREDVPLGTETILLVEDQRDVREVAREFLQLSGYKVLEAKDGAEALAIAESHQNQIDLMITDIIMPGMTGMELAGQMKELRPEMRVIFMSGYADYSGEKPASDGSAVTLQKPFTRTQLTQTVHQILMDRISVKG